MHQSLTSSNLFKSKDHTKYLIDVYERSNGGIAANTPLEFASSMAPSGTTHIYVRTVCMI